MQPTLMCLSHFVVGPHSVLRDAGVNTPRASTSSRAGSSRHTRQALDRVERSASAGPEFPGRCVDDRYTNNDQRGAVWSMDWRDQLIHAHIAAAAIRVVQTHSIVGRRRGNSQHRLADSTPGRCNIDQAVVSLSYRFYAVYALSGTYTLA